MMMLKNRTVRIVLLILVIFCIFLVVVTNTRHSKVDKGNTPAIGDYDTKGTVPGNPARSIRQMKHLFRLVQVYRKSHHGDYPADEITLLADISSHLKAYGFSNAGKVRAAFINPDAAFSDNLYFRQHPGKVLPYFLKNTRFNGEKLGSPKPYGTHDIVAALHIYAHMNTLHRNGQETTNPVGFYLVLWDNGEVKKVPYDKILYLPAGGNAFLFAYPTEAGVPTSALTYDQYYQIRLGWTRGPRGKVNGPGLSFQHQL